MNLPRVIAFEWDKGNINKNLKKHKVSNQEAEELFFNRPLKIFEDAKHSLVEKRFIVHGITNTKRRITIIFTLRNQKIRIVSARDQNRKERGYMKKNKLQSIPKFKNEDEEREFWANADTAKYFDYGKPVELDLSNLKPSTETISLRLPSYLLARIKELANKKDVPYQSLMKMFISERINQELNVK